MEKKGFSTVEILITIVILGLAIFPFMQVVSSNTGVVIDAKKRFIASLILASSNPSRI